MANLFVFRSLVPPPAGDIHADSFFGRNSFSLSGHLSPLPLPSANGSPFLPLYVHSDSFCDNGHPYANNPPTFHVETIPFYDAFLCRLSFYPSSVYFFYSGHVRLLLHPHSHFQFFFPPPFSDIGFWTCTRCLCFFLPHPLKIRLWFSGLFPRRYHWFLAIPFGSRSGPLPVFLFLSLLRRIRPGDPPLSVILLCFCPSFLPRVNKLMWSSPLLPGLCPSSPTFGDWLCSESDDRGESHIFLALYISPPLLDTQCRPYSPFTQYLLFFVW